MNSFENLIKECGGALKKFKNYALNLHVPMTTEETSIQEIIKAAQEEYGQENLIVKQIKKEQENIIEILFFCKDTILRDANKICQRAGLKAEIFEEAFTVGVGGDNRTYMPVMNISGAFPRWDIIEEISSEITNTLPINRVTYEIVSKTT